MLVQGGAEEAAEASGGAAAAAAAASPAALLMMEVSHWPVSPSFISSADVVRMLRLLGLRMQLKLCFQQTERSIKGKANSIFCSASKLELRQLLSSSPVSGRP